MKNFFKSMVTVDDIVSDLRETLLRLRTHEEAKAEEASAAIAHYHAVKEERDRASRIASNLDQLLK